MKEGVCATYGQTKSSSAGRLQVRLVIYKLRVCQMYTLNYIDYMSKRYLLLIGGVIVIIIGLWFSLSIPNKPGKYDQFAQCLKDKGAVFYGAFWCPHCQNEKKLFGSSEHLLPYVECSTLDGQNQLSVCQEKKIEGYPTWEFKDGSRETGEVSLEKLSEKTACPLPK